MKNKIYYSPEAKRDLDDIWEYIEADLCNRTAAGSMVNRIMDAVDQLGDFPGIGTPLSAIAETHTDYRYLVTGNFMTFYHVFDSNVYVDRVLYGRRDYMRILFGDVSETEA